MGYIKHVEPETVFQLSEQVQIQKGQVVSKTLAQNPAVSLTLFSFDQGEEISTHASHGDALVTVLEGKGQFTVDGTVYVLEAGESLVMPANKPHAVYGIQAFKMLLTVIFPESEHEGKEQSSY